MHDHPYPKPKHERPSTPPASEHVWDRMSGTLVAIMVTDLEGFTSLVCRLGDVAAQRVIHAHNEALRSSLAAHTGEEVAHTGDGMITAFRSVAHALQCAVEIQRAFRDYNRTHGTTPLRLRIGIHAGEPLPEESRLFGSCVITAVRICSVSQATHVLVSDLVWRLAQGRSFAFEARGPVALKGFAEPVDLYELNWRARSRRTPD